MRTTHFATFLVFAAAFSGCSEYDLGSTLPALGQANPRELVTPIQEDRLVQVPVPAADILFVVDNSSSMANEQAALSAAFPQFMNWFVGSGIDYHIGVVSTDVEDPSHSGKLREFAGYRWIDTETEIPDTIFSHMASMGITGSGNESGRAATYLALETERDAYNLDFRRDHAALHVVVISDERDWSTDTPISHEEFISWLEGQRGPGIDVTFNSIVNAPDCCAGLSIESAGLEYIDVSLRVGGILQDIKSDDWEGVLDQLGLQAAGLSREFFLSELPVPGTIEVEVDQDGTIFEMVEDVDWSYDATRNSIQLFEFVPEPLSKILIRYEVLSAREG